MSTEATRILCQALSFSSVSLAAYRHLLSACTPLAVSSFSTLYNWHTIVRIELESAICRFVLVRNRLTSPTMQPGSILMYLVQNDRDVYRNFRCSMLILYLLRLPRTVAFFLVRTKTFKILQITIYPLQRRIPMTIRVRRIVPCYTVPPSHESRFKAQG